MNEKWFQPMLLIFIRSVSLHITNKLSCWVLVWRNKRLTASYFSGGKKKKKIHPHRFPAARRDTTVTFDLVTLGHIKTSSVTVPSALRQLGDASVLGIMSALTRLACLGAVSHEVAYTGVGALSFPLCLTVRGRMGKPPTAAKPGTKMKHQRHSPPVGRLGAIWTG